jgi:hypothetical protein
MSLGMGETELRAHLRGLGVDEHSWPVVAFLPLVQVAWADGAIQDAERKTIVGMADRAALPGDGADVLRSWLEHRPSRGYFARGNMVVEELARRGGLETTGMGAGDIISACEAVAKAAGGLLGGSGGAVDVRERAVLEEVRGMLEPDDAEWGDLLDGLGDGPSGDDDDLTQVLLAVRSVVPGAEDFGTPGVDDARLVVRRPNGQTQVISLEDGVTVGRQPGCSVAVPEDGTLSRRHCRFERDERGWMVVDLGSHNGTQVDREKVESRRLFGGESVQAGDVHIAVVIPRVAAS